MKFHITISDKSKITEMLNEASKLEISCLNPRRLEKYGIFTLETTKGKLSEFLANLEVLNIEVLDVSNDEEKTI